MIIENQKELIACLNDKDETVPTDINIRGGEKIWIKEDFALKLTHSRLTELALQNHKFVGSAKEVLFDRIRNHRGLSWLTLNGIMPPEKLGHYFYRTPLSNTLTKLTLTRLKLDENQCSLIRGAWRFNHKLTLLILDDLNFEHDSRFSLNFFALEDTGIKEFRLLYHDLYGYECFCIGNGLFSEKRHAKVPNRQRVTLSLPSSFPGVVSCGARRLISQMEKSTNTSYLSTFRFFEEAMYPKECVKFVKNLIRKPGIIALLD